MYREKRCSRCPKTRPWDIFVAGWFFFLATCNIALCGYIEIVEEQSCHDTEFRLTCPSLDAHLAILEAVFTPQELSNNSVDYLDSISGVCKQNYFQLSYPHTSAHKYNATKRIFATNRSMEVNIRAPVSHRCTGINHCNFLLNIDYEDSVVWGSGYVYIKYACMDASRVTKYCNQEIDVGEGFIQTPGYPRFYVGEGACRWLLRAPRGQKVQVSLLDVSLRSIGPYEEECVDRLTIQDGDTGRDLLASCEQVEEPLVLQSSAETLDILVRVNSKRVYPKRGLLFHYKSIGCLTPPAPRDGYLVYRQGDQVTFMCCVGRAFVDDGTRIRVLTCRNDNAWDRELADCTNITSKIWDGNGTYVANSTFPSNMVPENDNTIRDIVIPLLLIAALFVGNAVVLLIIFKYRKRKQDQQNENEEFANLTMNGNAKHDCEENTTNTV